jgi:hypothetical protein
MKYQVGDKVVFVQFVPGAAHKKTVLVVTLVSNTYVYCEDLAGDDIHVFDRQHLHIDGIGWLESTSTQPLLLQGHSYAPGSLGDVLAAEEAEGRVVAVVIQHRGGWAVSPGIDKEELDE